MTTPGPPNIKKFPLVFSSTLQYWWQPPSEGGADVTEYELTVGPEISTFRLPAGTTNWAVDGLSNDTFYSASIRATCNYPEWGPSSVFHDWQPGLPPTTTPEDPFVIRYGRSNALVSWSPPAVNPENPIGWYVIRAKSANPANPSPEYTTGESGRDYYITGLVSSSTYYFTVEAVNSAGYSPYVSTNWIRYWPFLVQVVWRCTFSYYAFGDPSGISLDSSGNIYYGGSYGNGTGAPAPLGNSVGNDSSVTMPTTNSGNWPVLVKYNNDGIVQWATYILAQSLGQYAAVTKTKTDAQGNIYCLGQYTNTGTVMDVSGNGQAASDWSLITPANGKAIFLIKYNSSGKVQWANLIDCGGQELQADLVLDPSGNIYATGWFTQSFTLRDPSGNTQVNTSYTLSTTATSTFLIKYNNNGKVQWATKIDSSQGGGGIDIDSSGNLYVGGTYSGAAITLQNTNGFGQTDSSVTLDISTSKVSFFIAKYNSDGRAIWAANARTNQSSINSVTKIKVDINNNVYISGYYTSSTGAVIVQSASGNGQTDSGIRIKTTVGSYDIFLIKYNSNGIAQWATKMQANDNDFVEGMTCDASGNIYLIGRYRTLSLNFVIQNASGNTQVDSQFSLAPSGSSTNYKSFLVKYNPQGQAVFAHRLINNPSNRDSEGYDIIVDSAHNIYALYKYTTDASQNLDNLTFEGVVQVSNRQLTMGSSRQLLVKLTQPV